MKTTFTIVTLFPPALGFVMGAGLRGLVILLIFGAMLALVYGMVIGICAAAGEADDRAGAPRG